MRGKRLTPETIQEMQAYIAAGEKPAEVAKAFDVSPNAVYQHCNYSGTRPGGKPATSQAVIDKMKDLQKKGMSHAEIAKETCTSWGTVQKYLGQQKTGCKADYGSLSAEAQDVENAPVIGETREGCEEDFVLEERVVSLAGFLFSYKVSSKGRIKIRHKDGMTVDLNVSEFNRFLKELNKIKTWLDSNSLVRPNTQDEWRK